MTFIHPLLLSGLLLVGIPVLLHLIMRQQPKHLLFPALRFLLQRHRTNQRKLRLRHLLLLLLRMLLIAAICLALARPKIFNERLNLSTERPVAAILLFDTSPSMEYTVAGKSRLDEAKRRAQELLDDLPEGSQLVVLDSADSGSDQWLNKKDAQKRIDGLKVRPANEPITSRLGEAYRLLGSLEPPTESPNDILPRFLYIFSDRTLECWDATRVKALVDQRDRMAPLKVVGVFVDVGVDQPVDLAIASLEPARQAVPANIPVLLRATVQATGADYDTEIRCTFDGERTVERKPIQLKAGQSQVVTFTRAGLAPGAHQAEVTLATPDNLTFNNAAYATVEVRGARRLLTLTDKPDDVRIWKLALKSGELPFDCEVRAFREAINLSPKELNQYAAVCLMNVRRPEAGPLWDGLQQYVTNGGGLAIIPGPELSRDEYNGDVVQKLLPGKFKQVVKATGESGIHWNEASYQLPLRGWFQEWSRNPSIGFLRFPPSAYRYWDVQPEQGKAFAWVTYDAPENQPAPPALVERRFDPQEHIRGRVLLFTVPLGDAASTGDQRWHDYLAPPVPFYVALAKKTVSYLAGDAEEPTFNFRCGQVVPVPLPAAPRFQTYVLQGPGLTSADSIVTGIDQQSELHLTQPTAAGNYLLVGGAQQWSSAFSLNVPAGESQLGKVPVEQIEPLLGPDSVLSLSQAVSLRDALRGHWNQPIELFPWLMIVVLLVLAVENLLANKFYRRESPEEQQSTASA